MDNTPIEQKYETAFAQAGYELSGLVRDVKAELARIAENMIRQQINAGCDYVSEKLVPKDDSQHELTDSTARNGSFTDICVSTVRDCAASSGAAAISAVMSGSMNTMRYLELVKAGDMSMKDATVKIISETIASAADSAIKASGDTAMRQIISKYGSKEEALHALAEQGVRAVLQKTGMASNSPAIVEAITGLLDVGTGKFTSGDYAKKCGSLIVFLGGSAGNKLGLSAGLGAAKAFLAQGASCLAPVIQMVGKFSGTWISAVAMTLALKNGMEKSYRELVNNTQTLNAAASELERISRNMFKDQILFTRYLESDIKMETELKGQMAAVDKAGKNALDAILKI